MRILSAFFLSLFSISAWASKPTCFEEKKELLIPNTKLTLTIRGEVLNGTQKFANLPLPKGFQIECLITAPIKTDLLVILSMSALDYDKKNAFVFRVSTKDSKVIWSQPLNNPVQPHLPLITEKIVVVPTLGEAVALNPETGGIRWKFSRPETETVDFKKISLHGTATLLAEGAMTIAGEVTPAKFEISIYDGKIILPKK